MKRLRLFPGSPVRLGTTLKNTENKGVVYQTITQRL